MHHSGVGAGADRGVYLIVSVDLYNTENIIGGAGGGNGTGKAGTE